MLALSLVTATTAAAGTARLTVSPAAGPPGTEVVATGTGFCPAPCTAVTIQFSGVEVLTDVRVGAAGTFRAVFRVPGGTLAGPNTVVAEQHDASANPQPRQATARFDITPSTPASGSPAPSSAPSVTTHRPSRSPTTAAPQPSSASAAPTDHQSPPPATTPSPSSAGPSAPPSTSAAAADPVAGSERSETTGQSSRRWWAAGLLGAVVLAVAAIAVRRRSRGPRSHP